MGQDAKRKTDDVFIVVVLLSIVLFVASLTQIAFITQKPDDPEYSSLFVFGLGWAGFLAGNMLAVVLWLANPLYLLAIILGFRGKYMVALICSAIALIMATIFPFIEGIATSESGGGPFYPIVSLNAGYWLWLSAITFLAIANGKSYFVAKNAA